MSQWPARLTVRPEQAAALREAAGATRPHPAAPLLFSRMAAHVAPETTPQAMGVPANTLRHAGHEWTILTPLQVGNTYAFSDWALVSDETRQSRSGRALRFAAFTRTWTDEEGRTVQTERMTAVHTGVLPSSRSGPLTRPSRQGDRPGTAPRVVVDRPWDDAHPGEVVTEIEAGFLDRAEIASFGVLIGDLTPIHHDVAAAQAAGLPDVIAMGTFSAAKLLAVAEDRIGPDRIHRCALRFHRPVLPGEPLQISAAALPVGPAESAVPAFRLELRAAGELALSAVLEIRAA
jgi:acyl dehydratase